MKIGVAPAATPSPHASRAAAEAGPVKGKGFAEHMKATTAAKKTEKTENAESPTPGPTPTPQNVVDVLAAAIEAVKEGKGKATVAATSADQSATAVAASAAAPAKAAAPRPPVEDAPPLTPLEQAVHELLSSTTAKPDDDDHAADDDAQPATAAAQALVSSTAPTTAAPAADAPKAAAPVAPAPVATPPEQTNQNHAHLVLDDGAQRVVMTVAVRGSEVNVSMRASDDHTAAALARNAGALDQSLRGHGLELGQMQSEHDRAPDRHANRNQDQNRPSRDTDRNARNQHTEPFVLEENV